MAVSPRRWIALMVIGCLVLGLSLLPPSGAGVLGLSRLLGGGYWNGPDFTRDPLRFRRYHLSQAISRTEARIAALRLRDSLRGPVRESGGEISVVSFAGVAPGDTARARALADEVARRLTGTPRSRIRVILALQREKRDGAATSLLFLPGSVAEDACVVTVKTKDLVPGDLRGLISPCVFYSSFGVPGDSITAWLARRGYDVARDHQWWSPAALPPTGRVDVSWWSSRLLAGAFSGEWLDWVDPERAGCQAGRQDACASIVLTPRRPSWRHPTVMGDGIYALIAPSQYRWFEVENPARDGMLAELVREFGRDRFAAFWHSDKAVEEAFAESFGEPLPFWMRRWSQRRLGVTYAGPVIHWQGVFGWLVVAGAAVALSAAAAVRRQAT